jgi:hypothetical protein
MCRDQWVILFCDGLKIEIPIVNPNLGSMNKEVMVPRSHTVSRDLCWYFIIERISKASLMKSVLIWKT